ncbi:RNA polymerase sigma factor [Paenibacillus sp. HB172176]|uniref:RNA polymerase sigma factor n=1 Tax=Paenibacillus sp. HB172176 TaxID=2493690 RepID=UPI001438BCBC|nr:RNA polymerase sigma factor [Paenibacillus sp. HB172176]
MNRVEMEIKRRMLKGDRQAFRELYNAHFDYAMRTAVLVTRNREWAKDVVQETFVRVYKSIAQYDEGKPFKPWLYSILLRECFRVMEKEKKAFPLGEHVERLESNPGNAEAAIDIGQALDALQDKFRIPFILKYLHNYSEKEIAEMLELNVNTLKSRLLKGRELMRSALGGETYGSEA